MDFDHVSGEKIGCLATLADARYKLEKLKEEIAKCEIVCANCHRVRTWKRARAARKKHLEACSNGS